MHFWQVWHKNNEPQKQGSYSLYTGVLKCLCGPEGALNKLPVLISKHPFKNIFIYLFIFPFISLFCCSLMFFVSFWPLCFFLPHVDSKGFFLSNWKRTRNELMASVMLLWKNEENSFGRDLLEAMPTICWTGNPVEMAAFSLMRGRQLFQQNESFPKPPLPPTASLCFLAGPVQLFLHPLRERSEGIHLARARQQCTAVQRQEWSRESAGRNPIGWYPCQNSPSGSTILSSRALGRVRMKDSAPFSFSELRGCCRTAESSSPTGHEMALVTLMRVQ